MELTKKTFNYVMVNSLFFSFFFWLPWKFLRQLVRKYASLAFLVYV